jgi:hypothetical protein
MIDPFDDGELEKLTDEEAIARLMEHYEERGAAEFVLSALRGEYTGDLPVD